MTMELGDRDAKGRFATGNSLWRLAKYPGQKRRFKSPEDFWDAALKYFAWVEESPIEDPKLLQYKDEAFVESTPKPRAMTLQGLRVVMGVSESNWYEYENRPEFTEVCKSIKEIIFDQKFAGAAAGVFNAAIIARDLGLADKQDHTSSDGSMTPDRQKLDDFYD